MCVYPFHVNICTLLFSLRGFDVAYNYEKYKINLVLDLVLIQKHSLQAGRQESFSCTKGLMSLATLKLYSTWNRQEEADAQQDDTA